MTDHSNWIRVSRQQPCLLCGKPDNCSRSQDGKWVWCGRISEGALKVNQGGQFLHRLSDNCGPVPPPPRAQNHRSAPRDFAAIAQRLAKDAGEGRWKLAQILGVDVRALSALEVGWSTERFWSFPERDATGAIIGISARYENGDKRRFRGGNTGLTYARDWDVGDGPILLVEGGSDTAALLTMGLNVVGRPSNVGGVRLLLELLAGIAEERQILVVGERDQKPDGRWPGLEGAVGTAQQLAEGLDRPVAWSLPPDDAKDSRAWLQAKSQAPRPCLAEEFLAGLDVTMIAPPPRFTCEIDTFPAVPLNKWRDEMRRARIESLSFPDYYLDASSTGAGKSYADFETILHLHALEAA